MTLPHVPPDSSNERQHRTVIATAVNELIKVRPPNDRTAAEISAGVTPVDYGYAPMDARRYGWSTSADATTNTAALQNAIDVAEETGGGVVWLAEGDYNISGEIELKDSVSIHGAGPFATVITCTTAGVNGFEASSALNGIELANFQLLGTNSANASENGINLVGGAGGFPKLVMRNLLVKQWGNVGIYLENCWDSMLEAVNASSNKSHGFHIVGSFSLGGHKNIAYQNDGHGFFIQRAAGSFFSGTSQENKKNGWLIESAQGCHFVTYVEQNGWDTATDAEKAQIRVNQTSGGYARSSGTRLQVFALGGAGSTSPTMESKYGVYVDNARRIQISGTFGGHLDSDIRLTSNSTHVVMEETEFLTGLTSDTPTPINDTSGQNNVAPVRQYYASVPDTGTGNVGAGEDDLFTYTLPGGTLWRNTQAIQIQAWGTTAANANNKRIRVYFGATVVADTGSVAANTDEWSITVNVFRRGPTVQYSVIEASKYNGAPVTGTSTFTAPAETLANDITIKLTGEATSDNDIVQRGLMVRGL